MTPLQLPGTLIDLGNILVIAHQQSNPDAMGMFYLSTRFFFKAVSAAYAVAS